MGKKTPLARLRDPGTIFSDPDSEFSLSGREQRPLPRRLGPTLTARIRTGAIIVADDPPGKAKDKTLSQMNKDELLAEAAQRDGLWARLESRAGELGKDAPSDIPNDQVRGLIIDYDAGRLKENRMGDPVGWERKAYLAEIEERDGGPEKLEALIRDQGAESVEKLSDGDLLTLVQELMGIAIREGEND